MIIYGTRAKELAKENTMDKCTHCNTAGSTEMHVFQKYFHVFWIPFFPTRKIGVSQCNHCKQVLKQNEMSGELRETYERVKSGSRTPFWMFSGLALLVVLIASIIISEKNKDERNARLILTPAAGDVFEMKTADGQYTLVKVESVSGDSVFVQQNEYQTNKESGLNDIRKKGDTAFSADVYILTRKALKEMLDKGEILDIERKETGK